MYTGIGWTTIIWVVIMVRSGVAQDDVQPEGLGGTDDDVQPDGGSTDVNSDATESCNEYENYINSNCLKPFCFCDELCEQYNDCCKHDPDENSSQSMMSDDTQSNSISDDVFSNVNYHICVDVPPSSLYGHFIRGSYTLQYGSWMVGRCPPSWNDVIIKSLCEAPADGSDLMLQLPVVSSYNTMTSFRNIYCAMCHSVPLSTLTSWNITLDARNDLIKAWKDVNDSVGILEVLNSSHSFNQELIEFKPLKEDASRSCLKGVIESCPIEYENQFVIGQCQSYMDAVVQPITKVIYRNWYCALCNDAIDPKLNICQTFQFLPPNIVTTSLTALVDFRENKHSHSYFDKDIQTTCNRNEFLDPFSLRCRALQCSRGFLLENGVCIGQLLEDFSVITNRHCISTGYTELEVEMCLARIEEFADPCELWGTCLQTTTYSAMPIGYCKSQTEDLLIDLENNCTHVVRIILMVNATIQNVSDVLEDILSKDDSKWCHSEASIQQAVVKTGCLPTSNVTCYTYHSYDENNVYFTSWNNSEALFLRDFNAIYSLEETFYQVTYEPTSQGHLHTAFNATICGDPIILNCSLVALNSNEFAQFMEVEQLTDYNHLILKTGGALVCHHLVSNKPQRVRGYTIVTIICITLSILALIASFITYLVFPSLRNLPGRCVMSLIGAVFFGQLLLLITGDDVARSVSEAFCAILAVLLHYSWLSTFSWTNVLAFYLARALGPKAKPAAASQHRHSFLFFSLFGWGIPLVIIIICVILHFVPNLNLYYGVSVEITDTLSCNITDRSVRIAAILVPICVSLLANAVLFFRILTGFTFRRTPSSNIYSREAQKTRARRDAFISIKVGFLLAFSWIFSFFAIGFNNEPLLYIFCILTSLQGVYIFLAFTFTKQVRALWRDKLGLKRSDSSGKKYVQKPKKLISSSPDMKKCSRKLSPAEHQTVDSAQ